MAKKDKMPKLPKKVGGVKLPKDVRRTAKSALKLAQNPIAREIVSAVLVAGAAALTKKAAKGAPEAKNKAADIGSLIAQGVAAFVSGMGKPTEKKPEAEKPATPHENAKPKRGPKPTP
jgi:hypothetical protein